MDSTGLAAALAVSAGLLGAAQVAVMGRLGERIGALEAVMLAAIVTGVLVFPILLVARQGTGGLGETLSQPWWMLTGGALGAFIVLSITIAGPRIGTTAVVGPPHCRAARRGNRDRPLRMVRVRPRLARLAARRRHRPARGRGGADAQALTVPT